MYYLSFIRRTALWNIIALIVCVTILGVDFKVIVSSALSPDTFLQTIYAVLFFSIPVFILFNIVWIVYINFSGGNAGANLIVALLHDLAVPFTSFLYFFGVALKKIVIHDYSPVEEAEDFFQIAFAFVWTLIMVAFFALAYINIRRSL